MTEVNTNTFKGPNQGVADGYAPLTIIESGKVDADLTQVKNDLDYHVAVLQSIYNKLDTIATGATPDQDALDIVTRINASNLRIDVKNLATTVAQLVDITNALNTHIATTTQSAMHNQTSIKSTGLTYSNTPSTVITACNNLLDEIKNVRYQIHRMNGKNTWVDTPDSSLTSLKNSLQALIDSVTAHTGNTSNPHSVTKAQVGLGNVDNAKQATKTEFDAHATSTSNPHATTKSQVGLGNVDNAKQATKSEFDAHTGNPSAHHTRYTDAEARLAVNSDPNHASAAYHNYYVHPTSDGFRHVPANGLYSEGKILTATATPGQYTWADLPTITGGVPIGTIAMWAGSFGSIPVHWRLCDGQGGTPDLRNKFIVGAGDEYGVGDTGGEAAHTLTESEMPSHQHQVGWNDGGTINWGGGIDDGSSSSRVAGRVYTTATGGGQAHENRPPYYALCYIMKVSDGPAETATALDLRLTSVSANYTVTLADYTITVNASAGPVTITLPNVSNYGKIFNIKKMDASTNAVIIDGYGAETIDGALTQQIIVQYQSLTLQSTGTEWVII